MRGGRFLHPRTPLRNCKSVTERPNPATGEDPMVSMSPFSHWTLVPTISDKPEVVLRYSGSNQGDSP